jgi:hypothetical protein
MESSGVEGRVMVSEATKNIVERAGRNPFVFIKEKVIISYYYERMSM